MSSPGKDYLTFYFNKLESRSDSTSSDFSISESENNDSSSVSGSDSSESDKSSGSSDVDSHSDSDGSKSHDELIASVEPYSRIMNTLKSKNILTKKSEDFKQNEYLHPFSKDKIYIKNNNKELIDEEHESETNSSESELSEGSSEDIRFSPEKDKKDNNEQEVIEDEDEDDDDKEL